MLSKRMKTAMDLYVTFVLHQSTVYLCTREGATHILITSTVPLYIKGKSLPIFHPSCYPLNFVHPIKRFLHPLILPARFTINICGNQAILHSILALSSPRAIRIGGYFWRQCNILKAGRVLLL